MKVRGSSKVSLFWRRKLYSEKNYELVKNMSRVVISQVIRDEMMKTVRQESGR